MLVVVFFASSQAAGVACGGGKALCRHGGVGYMQPHLEGCSGGSILDDGSTCGGWVITSQQVRREEARGEGSVCGCLSGVGACVV